MSAEVVGPQHAAAADDGAALRHSEARQLAIMETALDCIIEMDHEGLIRAFNPAAERTFGYRAEEVIGTPLVEKIIPPAFREMHQRGLERYLSTGEARVLGQRLEVTAMRAGGEEFPAELAITQTRLGERPLFTAYLRDISERRAMEAQLRELNQQLEAKIKERTEELVWSNLRLLETQEELQATLRAEQELGELRANFVSTVSHEFRTPLGIILSSAELLDAHHEKLDAEERREHLRTIYDAVKRMSELMEEVLVFHKLDAGGEEWELEPLDLVALCRRLVDEVHSSTAHRCRISLEAAPLAPAAGNEKLFATF
jgi:PAS domain S-box-containing protein